MKTIEMIGCRFCDIVVYMAQLLEAMGEMVFVNDMTEDRKMSRYIPKVPGVRAGEILEFRGVYYGNSDNALPDECTYRFNLRDAGNWSSEDGKNGNCRIFVTDEEPQNSGELESAIRRTDIREEKDAGSDTVVLRDHLGIVTAGYCCISSDIGRSGVLKIPYSERDRKAELYLAVREDATLRPVSEKMSSILEELIHRIRKNTTNAEFDRAFRFALKGGGR